ncbi:MAG: site-2 protease family protein [Methanobacteriota archaeon]|nr:MAG: site-2 protease family protein [Euryarchaeota archaeon]
MNGYLIALLVFLGWLALVIAARRTGWLEKHSMSLMGPIIMWRTRKGRVLIDRISRYERAWTLFGKASLWICAGAMVTMMVLLLWQATIVPKIEKAPSPELILGVPGINPIIPIGYGILGLAVAMVVHEFSHGIMTRIGRMKITSLGILFLVFPIGAFVEPDNKELEETTRRKRSKVFAAGPASNIIFALVTLGLFSGVMMSAAVPVDEGALVVGVVEESPASLAGLSPYTVVTHIDGNSVTSADDVEEREADPGALVNVTYRLGGEEIVATDVADGLVVAYVVDDYGAAEAGLDAGMVIASLDDTLLTNIDALRAVMEETRSGQVVNVTVMSLDEETGVYVVDNDISEVRLSDKYEFYEEFYPDENEPSFEGKGYLGAGFLMLGIDVREPDHYANQLAHPFRGDRSIGDFSMSWLRLIALPFLDLAPLRSPVTDLYEPGGGLAWLPDEVFWVLTNSLYWIFWINLMLGLTNVLPAVPLDGGYIFRDGMDYTLSKLNKNSTKEQRDRTTASVTMFLALLVLFLILWQLIGPRL